MASWLVSNMAGWLKAEFSTCRITLKVVIYRAFFYKSQKPRINRGAYIFFLSASAQIRVTADNFTRGDVIHLSKLKARKERKLS